MTIIESHSVALAHLQAGRLADAERIYREILRKDARNVEALLHLGIIASMAAQYQSAIDLTRQACALRPDNPAILMNLGRICGLAGQRQQALAAYRRVTEIQPNLAEAHECIGDLLLKDKKPAEAEPYLKRAVVLDARRASAHNLLGVALSEQHFHQEAVACFDRALSIQPNLAEAHYNRGVACNELGRIDDAFASLDRAADLFLDLPRKLKSALFVPDIMQTMDLIEKTRQRVRGRLQRLLKGKFAMADPERTLDAMPFLLAYHGENERETQAMLTRLLLQAMPSLNYTAPHCAKPPRSRGASDRIRIGFVSRYFFNHTIGKLNAGLIHQLSSQLFEVVVMRFPGNDHDKVADFIRQGADSNFTLAVDLPTARRQIADLELDVLYYPEIGMDMRTYLLAFSRLAPVQCVSWGHPVTTGIPNVDYFLSSADLEPEGADGHYTERLVKLKSLTAYYYRPMLAPPALTRADFGLSPDDTLYVCPQTLFKIHPDFDAILGGILRADPRGRVIFLKGLESNFSVLLTQRFKRTLPDVVERILFLDWQPADRFLHLLANCDVMLDPVRFGGGNTSLEGFAVGIPIVTLAGGFLRTRLTYAMYRTMGLDDCVASNPDDYVRRAVHLGVDPDYRQLVRDRILSRNAVLYESADAVHELERFLVEAVDRPLGGARC